MSAIRKAPIAALVVLSAGTALAAEQPAPQGASSQRELLQPPKKSIPSPITDRFAVRGLYATSSAGTIVRYDNSAGVLGTTLSGEDDLGFSKKFDQFSVDMMFRMLNRHRLHADFTKIRRTGSRVAGQQVRFGDTVFLATDRLESQLDLRKLGLTYTYSVLRTERVELGLGLELHLLQLEGVVEAPARFARERLDGAGPFPSLNAEATWRMTRRFSLNLSGNYLSGNMEGVDGGYQSWHGDVQFRVRPNFTLGVGYNQTRYKIDSRSTDFLGYFDLKYSGPEAFLRVSL